MAQNARSGKDCLVTYPGVIAADRHYKQMKLAHLRVGQGVGLLRDGLWFAALKNNGKCILLAIVAGQLHAIDLDQLEFIAVVICAQHEDLVQAGLKIFTLVGHSGWIRIFCDAR